jgi:hypothetical protein
MTLTYTQWQHFHNYVAKLGASRRLGQAATRANGDFYIKKSKNKKHFWQEKVIEVPPRFELGSLDSKSKVLTITPWDPSYTHTQFLFDDMMRLFEPVRSTVLICGTTCVRATPTEKFCSSDFFIRLINETDNSKRVMSGLSKRIPKMA